MYSFPLYWIITHIQIKAEKKIHSLKQHHGILSRTNEAVTRKVTFLVLHLVKYIIQITRERALLEPRHCIKYKKKSHATAKHGSLISHQKIINGF